MEACRPAVASDAVRIADLASEAVRELQAQRGGAVWSVVEARPDVSAQAIAAAIEGPGVQGFVGSLDDVVVGFAIVGEQPLRDGTVLAVLSDAVRGTRGP